jgi:hypothetical protein
MLHGIVGGLAIGCHTNMKGNECQMTASISIVIWEMFGIRGFTTPIIAGKFEIADILTKLNSSPSAIR